MATEIYSLRDGEGVLSAELDLDSLQGSVWQGERDCPKDERKGTEFRIVRGRTSLGLAEPDGIHKRVIPLEVQSAYASLGDGYVKVWSLLTELLLRLAADRGSDPEGDQGMIPADCCLVEAGGDRPLGRVWFYPEEAKQLWETPGPPMVLLPVGVRARWREKETLHLVESLAPAGSPLQLKLSYAHP